MRFALIVGCGLFGLLSACATVDLAEMAPMPRASQAADTQDNVVIRASEKLVADFSKNGWAKAPDPRRMQKAASIFLRGMRAANIMSDKSYAGQAANLNAVRMDIQAAAAMMTQPIKAADVYLSMATDDVDLNRELASLEAVISSCHKAEMSFAKALEKLGSADAKSDMEPITSVAKQMARIANQYGARVRDNIPNYDDNAS